MLLFNLYHLSCMKFLKKEIFLGSIFLCIFFYQCSLYSKSSLNFRVELNIFRCNVPTKSPKFYSYQEDSYTENAEQLTHLLLSDLVEQLLPNS